MIGWIVEKISRSGIRISLIRFRLVTVNPSATTLT
jgi:hypothetical protein